MPFEKIAQDVNVENLTPLDVKCTSVKCEVDLHCYRKKRGTRKTVHQQDLWGTVHQNGNCWACGRNLVDWSRVHEKDMSDVSYTFEALNTELIRRVYWHTEIDQRAVAHALKKRSQELHSDTKKRLLKYIAIPSYPWDGRQTPRQGNIIYYAQHATATCCRKCMEYWYGIPKGIQLNDEQIDYFVELIDLYISDRMPQLQANGLIRQSVRSNGKN